MLTRTTLAAAALVLAAAPAAAQSASLAAAPAPAASSTVAAPRQSISVNPIGAVFQVYMGEFERSLTPSTSIGLSSSYWDAGAGDEESSAEVAYLSVDAKLRYYPSADGLQGFSLGGSVGYTTLSGSFEDSEGQAQERASAVSAGVMLDYNWLLGARKNFMVGTGLGAKRLFPVDVDTDDVTLAYPTARLSVGIAF